jgi:hypothetical protein
MLRLSDLTGPADGPPIDPPGHVVANIEALGAALGIDAMARLTQRAEIWSYGRNGRISCGGATRLMRAADEWIALSLTRPDDEDLVPAWIDTLAQWDAIERAVAHHPAATLVERGRLLGLPIARLGERAPAGAPTTVERRGDAAALDRAPVVVDLSSLWAGPLCSRLLCDMGMRVVKVESRARPDGARRGPAAFFDAMHHGKELVMIDFTRDELQPLVDGADVVIEGSRPRALDQLGIDRTAPRVWLSITGHGVHEPNRNWVGFGDDAAVAGGLVAWSDRTTPCFLGDAIADPLTGMASAIAVRDALQQPGRWAIDCNLAGVAAYVAGSLSQ